MDTNANKADIAATQSVVNTLRITRRSIMFFIRTILITVFIVLLCCAGFITAARLSNCYILINEGMSLRASSMLLGGDNPDLAVYFTSDCIKNDAALRSQSTSQFTDFTISNYEYDLIVDSMHVFPWQHDTYIDVIEQITSIKASAPAESGISTIPEWAPIRYRLHVEQIDARWYISAIELVEVNPALPSINTPNPDMSPLPMVTPTPEPTPIAFQIP